MDPGFCMPILKLNGAHPAAGVMALAILHTIHTPGVQDKDVYRESLGSNRNDFFLAKELGQMLLERWLVKNKRKKAMQFIPFTTFYCFT
jgi:hypothetical protein